MGAAGLCRVRGLPDGRREPVSESGGCGAAQAGGGDGDAGDERHEQGGVAGI